MKSKTGPQNRTYECVRQKHSKIISSLQFLVQEICFEGGEEFMCWSPGIAVLHPSGVQFISSVQFQVHRAHCEAMS